MGCSSCLYGCFFGGRDARFKVWSCFWSSASQADGFVLCRADVESMHNFVQWCPVIINVPADAQVMCFSRGWDWGRVTSLEVALYVSFLTHKWKGRTSVHALTTSVGADLRALVMCRVTCLCILASFLMAPFIPLVFWLPGVRKRSVVYIIFRTATEMKNFLKNLGDIPLDGIEILQY